VPPVAGLSRGLLPRLDLVFPSGPHAPPPACLASVFGKNAAFARSLSSFLQKSAGPVPHHPQPSTIPPQSPAKPPATGKNTFASPQSSSYPPQLAKLSRQFAAITSHSRNAILAAQD
jgi:hypothetical protein